MLSCVWFFATLWAVAHQAPPWWASPGKNTACSPPGLPWPPPGDLSNPGIKPVSHVSPALQEDSLLLNHWVQPRAFIPNIQFQTVCCSSEWHSVNPAIPKLEIVGYLLTVALGPGHEPMTCSLNLAHGGCEPRWHAHPMIKLLNSAVQLEEVSECVHVLCRISLGSVILLPLQFPRHVVMLSSLSVEVSCIWYHWSEL